MAGPAPALSHLADNPPTVRLGSQERAVLSVLVANQHRVISRGELSRLAGLEGLSERRCDSVLVQIRRYLGPESVTTVRGRGWRLSAAHVELANAAVADDR
jgi:DNA-binding winged helix-turn-helix (wHTH) protein